MADMRAIRPVIAVAAAVALVGLVGVAVIALRPDFTSPGVTPTPAPAAWVADADDASHAAQAASIYLIEELGGSTCQGGSGNEGVYTVDPELFDLADAAASMDTWLREDRVWLGDPAAFAETLEAEPIPGAAAAGDAWVLRHDDEGQPYAQHIVEHVSPGGRSVWIAMSTIVSLDRAECA
jgi:hypothetical protein